MEHPIKRLLLFINVDQNVGIVYRKVSLTFAQVSHLSHQDLFLPGKLFFSQILFSSHIENCIVIEYLIKVIGSQ